MEQTSLQAYFDIQDSLGCMQLRVLNFLRSSPVPLSHYHIAVGLGVFPNCVTGRIKELELAGFVVHDGFCYNPSGKKAKAWRVNAR